MWESALGKNNCSSHCRRLFDEDNWSNKMNIITGLIRPILLAKIYQLSNSEPKSNYLM